MMGWDTPDRISSLSPGSLVGPASREHWGRPDTGGRKELAPSCALHGPPALSLPRHFGLGSSSQVPSALPESTTRPFRGAVGSAPPQRPETQLLRCQNRHHQLGDALPRRAESQLHRLPPLTSQDLRTRASPPFVPPAQDTVVAF